MKALSDTEKMLLDFWTLLSCLMTDTSLHLFIENRKSLDLSFMFLQKLIIEFFVIILSDDIERGEQVIFIIGDVPVSLRLAPTNQLHLSFSRNPKVTKVEVLISDVVVIEEVDHGPQFI